MVCKSRSGKIIELAKVSQPKTNCWFLSHSIQKCLEFLTLIQIFHAIKEYFPITNETTNLSRRKVWKSGGVSQYYLVDIICTMATPGTTGKAFRGVGSKQKLDGQTVNRKSTTDNYTQWCFCSYADIGNSYLENSTYMKVIFTKNLTFIIIIYHTEFLEVWKKCNFLNFYDFYALKNGKIMHFFS